MAISERLQALLLESAKLGASDLHVHSAARLRVRIHGQLIEKGSRDTSPAAAEALLAGLLDAEQEAYFKTHGQIVSPAYLQVNDRKT